MTCRGTRQCYLGTVTTIDHHRAQTVSRLSMCRLVITPTTIEVLASLSISEKIAEP
jgi:hypothetical protein